MPIQHPFRFKFGERDGERKIRRVFLRSRSEKRYFRVVVYGDGKICAAEQFREVVANRYAYIAETFNLPADRIRKSKVERGYAHCERNRYVMHIIDLFDFSEQLFHTWQPVKTK